MPSSEDNKAVEDLIGRVKSTYSSCRSYEDRGQLTSILPRHEGQPIISYQTFSTAFVKPDKFRFEFRDRFPERQFGRHIAWREGSVVKTWSYQFDPRVKSETDLGLALAGFTGLSHGLAAIIPQLLLPDEVNARGLFDSAELELAGNEECQDSLCFKVRSRTASSNQFVWIAAESNLVLQVEEQTAIGYATSGWSHSMIVGSGSQISRTIIKYSPSIDVDIPSSQLEFGEPFDGYGDDVDVIN